jgi:hypothetical protein
VGLNEGFKERARVVEIVTERFTRLERAVPREIKRERERERERERDTYVKRLREIKRERKMKSD